MENQWLTWAKQLQAISASGQFFTKSDYDNDRYVQIDDIARNMLSILGQIPIEKIEGIAYEGSAGYATPKIDVRGAVIRENCILLVREKLDGLWTLPGGYAEVGLSAAENVEKEVSEEAGIRVRASRLYCVYHKAKHPYDHDLRDFYKMFFLCEQVDGNEPTAGMETTDVGFFDQNQLPPLSTGRVLDVDIRNAFLYHLGDRDLTLFD